MTRAVADVADAFLRAIEKGDMAAVGALYAPELRAWHSYDGKIQNRQENVATLAGMTRFGRPRYTVIERLATGDRLVQRHRLEIVSHDGSQAFALDAALFLTIRDGMITALDEFLDSAPVGRLLDAMAAAASGV